MVTDPPPRGAAGRRQFEASDQRSDLPLPPPEAVVPSTRALADALAAADRAGVAAAGRELLGNLARFYQIPRPGLKVLGARPLHVIEGQWRYELFGDYHPDKQLIRVWMRTAVHGRVTSHRGLLNTLLHELCHHLDTTGLGFADTPHTRGFFARVDRLYHLALETPAAEQRPLVWIKRGAIWRIDWGKVRPRKPAAADRGPER